MVRSHVKSLQITFALSMILVSCAPAESSTPFVPPTKLLPTLALPTTTPIPSPNSISPTTTPTSGPCSNDLNFIDDVTVEDGTVVTPGSSVDKQWLVTNSGSCNWDLSYRFKWIGGDSLGANTEQVLYPARAGTQAMIRVIFTAPATPGTYQSQWQAYGPDGIAFGDPVYIQITVSQ
jgi:hypothetical protein